MIETIGFDIDSVTFDFMDFVIDKIEADIGLRPCLDKISIHDLSCDLFGNDKLNKQYTDYFWDVVQQPEIFYSLRTYKNAANVIRYLRNSGKRVIFVTARHPIMKDATNYTMAIEKIKHDGIFYNDGRPKSAIIAEQQVDLFVEDSPKNIADIDENCFGTITMIFDQPWNKNIRGLRVHNWIEIYTEILRLNDVKIAVNA